MGSFKRITNITGWLVFTIALVVYYMSAERTGSLWDCGEFILGAYKLQVVHPPGAPLFLLIGRIFTYVAEIFSNVEAKPENIAFSVNLLSGICTAFAAMFICWVSMILGKLSLVGRGAVNEAGAMIAIVGAGLVAGLSTAFCTSIWFSAVEGEVYAMSTFFTTLTLWSTIKWYHLPDTPDADRWLLFTVYAAGLSIGVHLLSILTFPALAMFYYFKKAKNHTFFGMAIAAFAGVVSISLIQRLIIVGIPTLWSKLELFMVNSMGLPFHSGIIPTVLIVIGVIAILLLYIHEQLTSPIPLYVMAAILSIVTLMSAEVTATPSFGSKIVSLALIGLVVTFRSKLVEYRRHAQLLVLGAGLMVAGFSTLGVVVIRANVDTPVNMNAPSDAMRLIPYLNREQYGERALLFGPHFDARPKDTKITERYGRVGDRYEIVDHKIEYEYDGGDKMLFPRMGDYSQNRPMLYRQWMGVDHTKPTPPGRPNMLDNIGFLFNYQIKWMYWRYFMWNFAGRQNGEQGFFPWDKSKGHWLSGIGALDSWRLYDQSDLPERMQKHKARNTYFLLPFLFGLIGLIFHFRKRPNDAMGLLALFVITGIGIIIYSNQPPNEPRERDYVLAGSFFTYCIWIGLGVIALYDILRDRVNLSSPIAAAVGTALVLSAPVLMLTQNFDDHDRSEHSGARDYANNFLESCEPNAIIFTYGDNDTYPLWYAQEVEGIRKDVRVVNLSLIAVDWYIDLLRRKINDSPALKMTIPREAYRGRFRNQVFYYNNTPPDRPMPIQQFLKFIGEDHPLPMQGGRKTESHYPTKQVYMPVDVSKAFQTGAVSQQDTGKIVSRIPINISGKEYLIKDEIAILDVISSNINDRPVYFAVTCRPEKLFGMGDYMQLEGLGLRIIPVKTPSDPAYGIIGNGRVDGEKIYDNVMNKFQWGNFDQEELFVDRSYAPSVQSHQLVIRRAAFDLLEKGQRDKAIALIDKFLEAFPHMNFPYDYRAFYMIGLYLEADAYDKAKPHLELLAEETADYLDFYSSIDPEDLESSFSQDFSLSLRTMNDVMAAVKRNNDTAFEEELKILFGPYLSDSADENLLRD